MAWSRIGRTHLDSPFRLLHHATAVENWPWLSEGRNIYLLPVLFLHFVAFPFMKHLEMVAECEYLCHMFLARGFSKRAFLSRHHLSAEDAPERCLAIISVTHFQLGLVPISTSICRNGVGHWCDQAHLRSKVQCPWERSTGAAQYVFSAI